ncbi:MAG: hypothetical protein ACKO2P_13015 [Planctomycetota bacterium]
MKVRLVRPDNSGYREWCRQHRMRFVDHRPRDPLAREYHSRLMRWEEAVRRLLTESVTESATERVLHCEEGDRMRSRNSYLELDFVSGNQAEPRAFVEIKLRERTEGATTGWGQLYRSLTVARTRWSRLSGISVCVAMGSVLQTEETLTVSPVRTRDLRHRLQPTSGADGEVLWLEGREVADFGVSSRLFTEDDVQLLPELRQDMLHPVRVLERIRRQAPSQWP